MRYWRYGEIRHIQKDCKQKNREGKGKEKDSTYITESDRSDALILSLAESSESWVIDFGVSFYDTSRQDSFQNYVKSGLGKVYIGDEPRDIVRKDDVVISLSNGSTLKLRNVRHVPKLKRNLISVGQLADGGMKTTFDVDVCKITKGAMVMAHRKKKGTLHDAGFRDINFSCFIGSGC